MPCAVWREPEYFVALDNEAALAEETAHQCRIVQAMHLREKPSEVVEPAFDECALHRHGQRVFRLGPPQRDVEAAFRPKRVTDMAKDTRGILEELQCLLA